MGKNNNKIEFNGLKIENNFENKFWDKLFLRFFKRNIKYTEETVNILFIDDQDMPVVDNLRKAKYRVKKVKDIKDINDLEVKNAQIIFVDFEGVGKSISPEYQGIGLADQLKKKYGDSKFIILYTVQNNFPSNATIKSLFDGIDEKLRKDGADVTDYINLIRKGIENLK